MMTRTVNLLSLLNLCVMTGNAIYPMCSYATSNEIKLYVVSDQAKSYVVTQTSNETSYLQEVSSR